ncbi:hypothetical protein TTHERM_000940261 (macronuclear) [Tetrahymena thermophila SB210]|uniref:Uncharacterized protein n=1 Tax=Tetrahymena thermophila (strain SB210) TaxID=312017 RepID=W7WWM9_TETTS|nr:hypothetical protein TTHERM_000940261 [Tetrahymena thermophila SB210]EWS71220.1 hypothetical protein TTHERM_000940261 [Tetrahymena thermophila SB210]|eukprot:XP_012656241.1 hypothetical protein TTHERM_000940261 [Tetrahymena thermophila SB210]
MVYVLKLLQILEINYFIFTNTLLDVCTLVKLSLEYYLCVSKIVEQAVYNQRYFRLLISLIKEVNEFHSCKQFLISQIFDHQIFQLLWRIYFQTQSILTKQKPLLLYVIAVQIHQTHNRDSYYYTIYEAVVERYITLLKIKKFRNSVYVQSNNCYLLYYPKLVPFVKWYESQFKHF